MENEQTPPIQGSIGQTGAGVGMIGSKVEGALNEQMKKEFYSSYLYLSMAAHFESINLKGFANWMKIQANEETKHAMKIYNYTLERGGKVVFQRIDAPARQCQDSCIRRYTRPESNP